MSPAARAIVIPTMASALTGAVLLLLLGLYWPRAMVEWMRIRVVENPAPLPPDFAVRVTVAFLAVTLVFALAVLAARWLLLRVGVTQPMAVLAAVIVLAFTLSFAGETVSQIWRASGNLTAADSAGLIIDDARLTAHGWETIARRAAAASLYSAIMLAAFAGASALVPSRRPTI